MTGGSGRQGHIRVVHPGCRNSDNERGAEHGHGPGHKRPDLRRCSLPPPVAASEAHDPHKAKDDLADLAQARADARRDERAFGYRRDFSAQYELQDVVGTGGFGKVFAAIDRVTGMQVAVKVIAKEYTGDGAGPERQAKHMASIRNEVTALLRLRGTLNVVHLYGAFEDDENVYLVTEMCRGGEMLHRIGERPYTERTVASFMRAVLRTLAQCHANNIIHRDVKPGNFMFLDDSDHARVKAIDFGLAVPFEDEDLPLDNLGFDGTPWFMAPEMLRSEVVPATDVWAAGVMAHQLLTGRFPFNDRKNPMSPSLSLVWRSILMDELSFNKPYWADISDEGKDFVRRLLQKEPGDRLTAKEALQHPWLAQDDVTARHDRKEKPISSSIVSRIQRYSHRAVLKRTVLEHIAEEILCTPAKNPDDIDIPRQVQDKLASNTHAPSGNALMYGSGPLSVAEEGDTATPFAEGGSSEGGSGSVKYRRLGHSRQCMCEDCLLLDRSVHKVLRAFNFDRRAAISREDLGRTLQQLGYDLADQELQHLMCILDGAHVGEVNRGAFAASLIDWKAFQRNCTDQWLEHLKRAFAEMDQDGDGCIWVEDMLKVLRNKLPPQELEHAVEHALVDAGCREQRHMNFEDFARMMHSPSADALDNLDIYDDRQTTRIEDLLDRTMRGANQLGGLQPVMEAEAHLPPPPPAEAPPRRFSQPTRP
ncbi:unnamed protein product [Pedinophyceae sp. YPF-701]|nr:unnamed protein product [Pedinophyceae sp. YPF-701]